MIAFIFRVLIINYVNTDYIAPDGTGYYHLANNLAEGKGYIMNGEKYFFREPGYPLFLSIAFHIANITGYETGSLEFDENFNIINTVPEIVIAKYLQALIDSITCVLLFLLISGFIRQKYALIIAFSFCLFFHYAYYTTNILRETTQSFFAIAMCYSFLQYLRKNSLVYLILTGFLWGILNLIFYPNLIFAFSIPIFIWIYKKSFSKMIAPTIIILLTMTIIVSPWLYRSYSHFPDIRIFKSFGTSLTTEYLGYHSSLVKAEYYNLLNKGEANSIFRKDLVDNISESERFRVYWDGSITTKTDSLNALINEPIITKRKIVNLAIFAKNIAPPTFSRTYQTEKPIVSIFLIFIIALYCLFALIGFFSFFKRLFPINIVLLTYLSAFFILASESRRMLPIQPFLFTYCILGILLAYYKFFKRIDSEKINEMLFKI